MDTIDCEFILANVTTSVWTTSRRSPFCGTAE